MRRVSSRTLPLPAEIIWQFKLLRLSKIGMFRCFRVLQWVFRWKSPLVGAVPEFDCERMNTSSNWIYSARGMVRSCARSCMWASDRACVCEFCVRSAFKQTSKQSVHLINSLGNDGETQLRTNFYRITQNFSQFIYSENYCENWIMWCVFSKVINLNVRHNEQGKEDCDN